MRKEDNSFEAYMRGDLTGEIGAMKETISNLHSVNVFAYDNLVEDKILAMGVLGVNVYVQKHIIDELEVILDLLSTV